MINLSNKNGLIHWNQKEIRIREMLRDYFVDEITEALYGLNKAWTFHQCDSPILNLAEDPMFRLHMEEEGHYIIENPPAHPVLLGLRGETTKGSYEYATYLQKPPNNIKLPLCVYQYGKSFRREQDQPTKFMRLKEFYQLEFQCIYSEGTKCDYMDKMEIECERIFGGMLGKLSIYLEDAPRIPSYSSNTTDIIHGTPIPGEQMELCSISQRTDYSYGNVLEIAIGMDRCVYAFLEKLK